MIKCWKNITEKYHILSWLLTYIDLNNATIERNSGFLNEKNSDYFCLTYFIITWI